MNSKYLIKLALLMLPLSSLAQQKMTVHLKDGQQVTYNVNQIDYVEMEAGTTADNKPAIEGIEGVEGEAVDLGLSVKWADINLGAKYCTDDGKRFSWNDAADNASKWGEGWRLPTEKEWQELYDKCTWSWTIRDGVGGRLITGKNGNSIFIPATGVLFEGGLEIRGCIGIYWTMDESKDANNAPQSAVGAYFDSANIYRIDYPRINLFSVRLVK